MKSPAANDGDVRDVGFDPRVGKIPWRGAWQPTPVFMPGESHGQRNLSKLFTVKSVKYNTCVKKALIL